VQVIDENHVLVSDRIEVAFAYAKKNPAPGLMLRHNKGIADKLEKHFLLFEKIFFEWKIRNLVKAKLRRIIQRQEAHEVFFYRRNQFMFFGECSEKTIQPLFFHANRLHAFILIFLLYKY